MGIVIMETLSLQHHLRIMLDHIEEASRELRIPVDIDRAALVMIARSSVNGNLGEAFRNIRSISKDLLLDGGSVVPYIALDGIVISGK